LIVTGDTTLPTYSDVGTNTTEADQPCLFHAKWTDDMGLSGYIFSTNNTGTWTNDTWTPLSGVSDWSNVTKTLDSTVGARVEYMFYCNDTSDNLGSTTIQSLIVTEPIIWYNSELSLLVSSSPALVGYKVNVVGRLSYDGGSGIPNAPVELYYSGTGGESWNFITSTTTNPDGSYSMTWFTMYTGNYNFKAVYTGDENSRIIGDEAVVNLIITDIEEQIFSVSSNSTVSNLVFNSTAREITFNVTGTSGTTGYLDIFLSKNLVPDTNDLIIYFDGVEMSYEVLSVDDVWFIHLTYDHSTHTLKIVLSSASPTYAFTEQLVIVSITTALAIAVMSLALFRKKKIRK